MKPRWIYSCIRGLALVAVLMTASLSTASAGSAGPSNPHTIVSDDGAVKPPASAIAVTGLTEAAVQARVGDGRRAPEAQQAINLDTNIGSATIPTVDNRTQPMGSIGTQSLYVDTRYPIANPAAYPNSTMVLLTLQNGTGSYRCSGFLIDPNTVATAGHCLHFNGTWSYNVYAYPGYTGSSAPYGSCSARRLYSVTGWVVSKNTEYDYGVVKLNCNIGNSTGWLGFRWQSASLDGLSVRIQGYPADKGWSQWGHNGSVNHTYIRTTYSSPADGFNGAPVFDNGLYAVAIFSTTAPRPPVCNGDICTITSASYSRGTRITQEVYNNLLYWRSL